MTSKFSLTISSRDKRRLFDHLFPGDGDEHGAVLHAGMVRSPRGLRLLVKQVVLAKDGTDYVPGQRGYRMLTGRFVTEQIRHSRDHELCYLAVHNHGAGDRVGFSAADLTSHERGYPALLDIARGQPVGALVFATEAAAGDLWISRSDRIELDEARVVGPTIERLRPRPLPRPLGAPPRFDRQARLFGDAGQALLADARVGVIGSGGVGALVVQYLARLGVGEIVCVDPERIEPSNVPRIVESTIWDARTPLLDPRLPRWVRRLAQGTAALKIDVMKRIVRRANRRTKFTGIAGDFVDDAIALQFKDCDYLFLAADSFQARLVFNAVVHQFLVPGAQIGSKVPVDARSGDVGDVFSVVRPVFPSSGCLLCNGLIPPGRLQEEAATPRELEAQRYVEDEFVHAPSVITLNAVGAGIAVNDFLFSYTGLRIPSREPENYLQVQPRKRSTRFEEPRADTECLECGSIPNSRFAAGDGRPLPTR